MFSGSLIGQHCPVCTVTLPLHSGGVQTIAVSVVQQRFQPFQFTPSPVRYWGIALSGASVEWGIALSGARGKLCGVGYSSEWC